MGSVHEGKPNVAPAHHAVILQEDFRTMIYSEPIISWSGVYMKEVARAMPGYLRQFSGEQAPRSFLQ
jgi:hypothetical protein